MASRGREDEAGVEEGGEMMVEVSALPGKEGKFTHTHTRAPVLCPQLLITTDTRRLQLEKKGGPHKCVLYMELYMQCITCYIHVIVAVVLYRNVTVLPLKTMYSKAYKNMTTPPRAGNPLGETELVNTANTHTYTYIHTNTYIHTHTHTHTHTSLNLCQEEVGRA